MNRQGDFFIQPPKNSFTLKVVLPMLHYEGLLLGVLTFVTIGVFHPIVIKTEYHFGTRPWWVFLLIGIGCAALALFIESLFWSALCGIVGFSSLWTIKELFEQEERVRKGWFPRNPRRRQNRSSGSD